ncbi:hypothetical protein [Fluviibacterium sp. S390]
MDKNKTASEQGKPAQKRDDRLKAALKANLARRKKQARLRQDTETKEG